MLSSILPVRHHAYLEAGEEGFTLIEILVVIIIIGILAAVAIPVFLNQQRTARDSGVTSDVRNLATNAETGLVADAQAGEFELHSNKEGTSSLDPEATKDLESLYLKVGSATPIEVSKTEGTLLDIEPGEAPGSYVIMGWNEDGQEYKKEAPLVYESTKGGIVKDSEWVSEETGPVDRNSSFEKGAEGWGLSGDWEIDNTEAHTGSKSVKVVDSASVGYLMPTPIDGKHGYDVGHTGEKWRVSVWVKVEGEGDFSSSTGQIVLGMAYDMQGGGGNGRTVPDPGTGWSKVTITKTINQMNDGKVVVPNVRVRDVPGGEFTFWFDDLTIEKIR